MIARRKKNSPASSGKEIFINVGPIEKRVAIMDNGRLIDYHMEREGVGHYAGSIYNGKVSSIVQGMDAAFVDIGMAKNGFLHVSDVLDKAAVLKELLPDEDAVVVKKTTHKGSPKIKDILKQDQEIMVQVVKESIGTKGPRLTSFISIPGRFLVLTPFDDGIGISRRIIQKEERKRIRAILGELKLPEGVGCIVRTVAENRPEKEFKSELNYLLNLWGKVKSRAQNEPAPTRVYEEYGIILKFIRDSFTDDFKQLVVDSKDEYVRIGKFLNSFMPSLRQKVKLYSGKTELFQKYHLDKRVDEMFERRVELKSGGSIVIEQTESLVAIDVNTGKFTGKRNLEETAFKTNLEAAAEIPQQLRLRDIGGIIIIDFIDMEIKDHRDKVYNLLQDSMKDDKARINHKAISQFGLVEMTRQRMYKSIEGSSHIDCPYCRGKGVVKSGETIAIEAVRKLDRMLASTSSRQKHIRVVVHTDVHTALISDQAKMLSEIQRKYRCKIDLREDTNLHIEDVIFEQY